MIRAISIAALAALAFSSVAGATTVIDRTTISVASSATRLGYPATNVLDGNQLLGGPHSDKLNWMTEPTVESFAGQYIKFDLGQAYDLAEIKVWNYNDGSTTWINRRSLKQADIQYAASASDYANNIFTTITGLENVQFAKRAGPNFNNYTLLTLPEGFNTQYIRISVDSNWNTDQTGTIKYRTGLAEVEFFKSDAPPPAPVPEPLTMSLVGMGIAGLGFYTRRRMKN